MELKNLFDQVIAFAQKCGMSENTSDSKGNCVIRKNIKIENGKFKSDAAYFGFIREDQGETDVYEDYSLVFFPLVDNSACVVALGIGTGGIVNDGDLASKPWIRRLFTKLYRDGAKTFFKNDFGDVETYSADLWNEIKTNSDYQGLKKCFEKYRNYIPACEILDFPKDGSKDEANFEIIKSWIATYAYLRNWPTKAELNKIEKYIPKVEDKAINIDSIFSILHENRFVILQGAPGTGKTHSALEVAKKFFKDDNVFFEQFHAETTYSDFIYGIRPKLNSHNVEYEAITGKMYEAIDAAEKAKKKGNDEIFLLIIDEINRANLSNVLGPVFYLFEKNDSNHYYSIKIGDKKINSLPDNLYVIATMNTADRSLAVVDFALRRRFTWLTLKPHKIDKKDIKAPQKYFDNKRFDVFNYFFDRYATDEELNLQPGQSYFIVSNEDEMKNRLRYELMPLMKEYFNEGFLLSAKDEVSNYFQKELGVLMYE